MYYNYGQTIAIPRRMIWMINDGNMIPVDQCGLNYLTFVCTLRLEIHRTVQGDGLGLDESWHAVRQVSV